MSQRLTHPRYGGARGTLLVNVLGSLALGALAATAAAGKGAVGGAAAAYVCVGTTCTLPLKAPKDLEDHLRTL